MARYEEQLDRVRRYFNRFEQLNKGMEQTVSSEECMDCIYAFFQNCYHLKDWLKNDSTFIKHTDQQIEDYVTNTQSLAICADICNDSKHLVLNKPPRSGHLPTLKKTIYHVSVTDCLNGEEIPTDFAMQVKYEHDGRILDAFQVATDALNSWESFLS